MSVSAEWTGGWEEIGLVFLRVKWSPSLTFIHFFEQVKIMMSIFLKVPCVLIMVHIFKSIFLNF